MRILCIDPSTTALGWAIFERREGRTTGDWRIVETGCIRRPKTLDWIEGIDFMTDAICLIAMRFEPTRTVIEQPQTFGSSTGMASQNSSSILKLMGAVFALRERLRCLNVPNDCVELVLVSKWKGQVKKHITAMRIKRRWKWSNANHNITDAVGIGDWWIRNNRKGH